MSDTLPDVFEYDALDEETRAFVQQRADQIHGQLKRTAEGILQIGQNLRDVKTRLKHGQFLSWLHREFAMSSQSAHNFMHVAERFSDDKFPKIRNFSATVLYALASPSMPESIIHHVNAGTVEPTLGAIKAAKEALKQAEEEKQQALTREEALRHHVLQIQAEFHQTHEHLNEQIASLQQQLVRATQPPVEIKEVVKEVLPPDAKAQLERVAHLQETIVRLTNQRDALAEKARVLGEEAQDRYLRTQKEREDQQRLHHWRGAARTFHGAIETIVARLPSPVDLERFEAEDWQWVSQVKEDARRLLAACEMLEHPGPGSIVDASP